MKISDFLEKPFPSEDGYRLYNVSQIFQPKTGAFRLQLKFHRIYNLKEKLKAPGTLRKFEDTGILGTFKTNCDVAFERLFVVGSIWSNKGNPQVILPSAYMEYCSIPDEFLESNNYKIADTSIFNQSFGVPEEKHGIENIDHSGILMYELDTALYKHAKNKNTNETPFYKHIPPWADPEKIDFVAFNSYEIHRYFFSSATADLTNFNSRLLVVQFNSNTNPDASLTFDPVRSIVENGKYLVYLRRKDDLNDSHVIGNVAYYPAFRDKIRKMQNYLNTRGYYYFSAIDGLPIVEFSRMKGYAFRVSRNDGKRGLYFVQLHSCSKTIDHTYTPIVPKNDGEVTTYPDGGGSGGNGGRPAGDPEVQLDVDYGGGSNPKDKPVEIDALGLDELLNPIVDIRIEEPEIDKLDEDRRLPDGKGGAAGEEEGGFISPPGIVDQEPGYTPVIRETIRARDYFDHFPNILKAVRINLQKSGLQTILNFYAADLQTYQEEQVIDCNKLLLKDRPIGPKWSLYLGVFQIMDKGHLPRYYYLFEKTSVTKTNSRTWLYSAKDYAILEEESLLDKIRTFLYEDDPTDAGRTEPNNKFNHKQTHVVTVDGIEKDQPIPQKDAIDHQIEKITARILKTFGK